MCEIDFISEREFDLKYWSPLDLLVRSPRPRMVYDQKTRKIRIRSLVGKSAIEFYHLLCHEVLHAVLHKVKGLDVCLALDNISNEVDGKYAYIWMGEDWKKTDI